MGYHLVLVKDGSCQTEQVTSRIQQYSAGASLVSDVGSELTYLLPKDDEPSFPDMFETLEGNRKELGIDS